MNPERRHRVLHYCTWCNDHWLTAAWPVLLIRVAQLWSGGMIWRMWATRGNTEKSSRDHEIVGGRENRSQPTSIAIPIAIVAVMFNVKMIMTCPPPLLP
jgi:hypothetical protein